MKRFAKKRIDTVVELNITAFMNLMVILVPFLLITAVFSRITVLELNLPGLNQNTDTDQQGKLSLELVVRENSVDIQDSNLGVIKRFEYQQDGIQWNKFSEILVEIKSRFPDEKSITLLLEPKVNYRTLIKVMDHVRSAEIVNMGTLETVELFPVISIGDAVAEEPVPQENNGVSG